MMLEIQFCITAAWEENCALSYTEKRSEWGFPPAHNVSIYQAVFFCLFYIRKFWFWEKIWKLGMKNLSTAEQSLEKILKIAISCIPALGIWMLSIKTVGTDEDSSCWRQDTADGNNSAMSTCLVSLCQSPNIPGLLLQLSRRSLLWNIYISPFSCSFFTLTVGLHQRQK